MKGQFSFRIDSFGSRSSKKKSPVGCPAAVGITSNQSAGMFAPLSINFGHHRGLAARIVSCFTGLLLLVAIILVAPSVPYAGVAIGVSVTVAPPALPVYVQPLCPGPGYIWVPGYWAWDPDFGYYWVPGTWVLAPFPDALWTPGYWGWNNGVFVWYEGYWGPVVGFYGGINYGFGYTGFGYEGGYWRHGEFYYNRSVNNISVTNIRNVYNKTVIRNVTTRVSYNSGPGGTTAHPTAAQLTAARERRGAPTDAQKQNERIARTDPKQRVSLNRGRPTVAATPKPGVLTGRGVIRATRAGAPYKAIQPKETLRPGAHTQTSRPAITEKRRPLTVPEHAVPRVQQTHPEPRKEPAERTYRRGESRPAPERPAITRQPSLHRAAPPRPEVRKPKEGNIKREEQVR